MSGEFDATRRDDDFLVKLDSPEGMCPFSASFGLKEALKALLGCPVDLIDPSALDDHYFAATVETTRQAHMPRDSAPASGDAWRPGS